ncbi:adenosylcobinamide-GDP ribazoletransferase [Ignavigranum ruoffiae]|uniref:Adenosylcobinamide-GDP ribazoletransferase n=1 Tax=Ignavigranum ruoffiae TaxID=89093 RepID=A0A1H9CHH1_9LACT|nr:adenosylcobinamide-GDP ribazoletransferase [Ignavigranum ruoffiae]SEQ00680.1 cobalamin-5'-phosphate synthase [Ignavigranum ruoffiae]
MQAIILYFQFFTALSIPIEINNVEKTYREGIHFFPIFAFLYASIHAICFYFLQSQFSLEIVWLFLIFLDVILTRGFHYDALADMADGMLSSRKKDDVISIMKDSHIGAMGTIILILYFMGMYICGFENLHSISSLEEKILYIIGIKTLSRGGISFLCINYRHCSEHGLGLLLEGIKTWRIFLSQLIFLGVAYLTGGLIYLIVYLVNLFLIYLYRKWVEHKIKGMNGDTVGASTLIGELFMHFILTIF